MKTYCGLIGILASTVFCSLAQAGPLSDETATSHRATCAPLSKIVVAVPEGSAFAILTVDLAVTFLIVFLIRRRVLQSQR